MRSLELLAPAKNYEHGRDAVLCGADAVYIGAPRFGARSAAGVSTDDIRRLCDFSHLFGARVYVAMNTLLWDDELLEAEKIATEVYEAGADALIIQDMAFLRMDLPPIDLHSSTQMFNISVEKARFYKEAGFSRLVTERALSLPEIKAIADTGIEVEAFIHGAICVCHSGRCYMSRTTGRRSGNRGECSQSCRLQYNLLDSDMRPMLKNRHLLSVQDLNLTGYLERMIDAGVGSFKIEGRLKDTAYLRNTVSWYRQRLDEITGRRKDLQRSSAGHTTIDFTPDPAKTFSRGGTSYFIDGKAAGVSSLANPKSTGEYIGRVASVGRDSFILDSDIALSPGDGLIFTVADGVPAGTNVNAFSGGRVEPNRMDGIRKGTEIYRNHDHRFIQAIEKARLKRVLPVSGEVIITATNITLTLYRGQAKAVVESTGNFEEARNAEKAEETIRTQLSKTGDTIYVIEGLNIIFDTPRFIPAAILNDLRRKATAELDKIILASYRRSFRLPENLKAEYPFRELTSEDNVTNRLSGKFYRDHGVISIEPGLDLADDLTGARVMQTRYCLRRELGRCLKGHPKDHSPLFLENRLHIYELKFDCGDCRMDIIYRGKRDTKGRR